jgi:S1-C subfamily serine protease
VTPTPEEPPEEGPDRDDSGSSSFGSDAAWRGWIDPDDRLWRHPSEVAGRAVRTADTRPIAARHPKTVVLIGAAATLAAVAWAIVLLSPPSDHPASLPGNDKTDATLTTSAVKVDAVPPSAAKASRSMVQLRAETSHGTVSLVGVAVAEGGLVVTTADGLTGLRSLFMVGAGGRRMRADEVAVDGASDLALISVPDDLPVAPFADDGGLGAGSTDMTLSMVTPDSGSLALTCLDGSVTAVGNEIATGWAKGMPAITSSVPPSHLESGDPLLNAQGAVIGILYNGASSTFLPTQLVLGVADDLRSTGKVDHGWLGVKGATDPAAGGARVAALMEGSPATGVLEPGDVVVAVNDMPVRSMADLRARLYVMPPSSTVGLTIDDGSGSQVVDVTLSASP